MAGFWSEFTVRITFTGDPTILTVPVHGNKDLKKGTVHKLLKDSGLTEDDL